MGRFQSGSSFSHVRATLTLVRSCAKSPIGGRGWCSLSGVSGASIEAKNVTSKYDLIDVK